jgi:hypothetical protein
MEYVLIKKGGKTMDNSLKGLILAAGVIITCLVIGLGFYISREAQNTSSSSSSQINDMSSEFQSIDLAIYDGMQITGREVIDFIKRAESKNEFVSIEVTNKKNNVADYIFEHTETSGNHAINESGTVQNIITVQTSPANQYYINPDGKFEGTVLRDQNDIIVCVKFVQV